MTNNYYPISRRAAGFYYKPVALVEGSTNEYEIVEQEFAQFYSVYSRDGNGLSQCVGDLEKEIDAIKLVNLLKSIICLN